MTTIACTSTPVRSRAATHAATVAPVVTTSSTSTTGVPAGGRPARRASTRPARLACRRQADRVTHPAGQPQRWSDRGDDTRTGQRSGRPLRHQRHVLPATSSRRRPPRRHRHQAHPTAVCLQAAQLSQCAGERAAQRSCEVAAAPFLVGQQGSTQPAAVGPQRVHRRASRAARRGHPYRHTQQRLAGGAQQRARHPATTAFDGQQQIQQ
jgi:hypothetical protein